MIVYYIQVNNVNAFKKVVLFLKIIMKNSGKM